MKEFEIGQKVKVVGIVKLLELCKRGDIPAEYLQLFSQVVEVAQKYSRSNSTHTYYKIKGYDNAMFPDIMFVDVTTDKTADKVTKAMDKVIGTADKLFKDRAKKEVRPMAKQVFPIVGDVVQIISKEEMGAFLKMQRELGNVYNEKYYLPIAGHIGKITGTIVTTDLRQRKHTRYIIEGTGFLKFYRAMFTMYKGKVEATTTKADIKGKSVTKANKPKTTIEYATIVLKQPKQHLDEPKIYLVIHYGYEPRFMHKADVIKTVGTDTVNFKVFETREVKVKADLV